MDKNSNQDHQSLSDSGKKAIKKVTCTMVCEVYTEETAETISSNFETIFTQIFMGMEDTAKLTVVKSTIDDI